MSRGESHQEARCQICGSTHRAILRGRSSSARRWCNSSSAIEKWDENGWICLDDLHKFQTQYVRSLLEAEKGELTDLELEVIRGLREHEILAKNPEAQFESNLTLGQRLADRIASFGGSWQFITIFAVVLFAWMFVNSFVLATRRSTHTRISF